MTSPSTLPTNAAGTDAAAATLSHLPGAFQRPHAAPAPVPFPDRPKEPSQATRDRWARQARVLTAARTEAHDQGVQEGYMRGARTGMWCGAICGAIVACVLWGAWLVFTTPSADAASPAPAAIRPLT